MLQTKLFNRDDGLDGIALAKLALVTKRCLDCLLGSHAHLLQEFPHRHVECVAHPAPILFVDSSDPFYLHLSMLIRTLTASFFLFTAAVLPAGADDRLVRLAVPDAVNESGLMKYMLPRFTLKTQVRVEVVSPGEPADAAIGDTGMPVFTGVGRTWSIEVLASEHEGVARFAAWITDATGQRAIEGFTVDGNQPFTLPIEDTKGVKEVVYDGDRLRGKQVSRTHCGRCHVTAKDDENLGIGSTPSFSALRGFEDWDVRFAGFYQLKPHGAFTQIKEVTEPFPEDRPSPIAPMELTLDDIGAILAYVAGIEPATLGASIKHQ